MTTKTEPEYSVAAPFSDARNITYGAARIIWAKGHGNLQDGWVLPGGARTDNFTEAHAVAVQVDGLSKKKVAV